MFASKKRKNRAVRRQRKQTSSEDDETTEIVRIEKRERFGMNKQTSKRVYAAKSDDEDDMRALINKKVNFFIRSNLIKCSVQIKHVQRNARRKKRHRDARSCRSWACYWNQGKNETRRRDPKRSSGNGFDCKTELNRLFERKN